MATLIVIAIYAIIGFIVLGIICLILRMIWFWIKYFLKNPFGAIWWLGTMVTGIRPLLVLFGVNLGCNNWYPPELLESINQTKNDNSCSYDYDYDNDIDNYDNNEDPWEEQKRHDAKREEEEREREANSRYRGNAEEIIRKEKLRQKYHAVWVKDHKGLTQKIIIHADDFYRAKLQAETQGYKVLKVDRASDEDIPGL